jgi:hypothetical protein
LKVDNENWTLEQWRNHLANVQHRKDDVKGEVRGVIGRNVKHWLETAMYAATRDEPKMDVVIERLEDSLAAIEKLLKKIETL